MSYFLPSADRGKEYRDAMDSALVASAAAVLQAGSPKGLEIPKPTSSLEGQIGALDYGAYFDLALGPTLSGVVSPEITAEATRYLTKRLSEISTVDPDPVASPLPQPYPKITNLSAEYYSPTAIDRMSRWWDFEPDNAMGLTGVSGQEFVVARERIAIAIERLRQCAVELHDEIAAVVNEIIVATSNGEERLYLRAATTFALWGSIAIDAGPSAQWPHYYRTIVHEAGHNLLFALARNEPLVCNDPAARYQSPLRSDLRPMDGIFHGAFVSARESLALDRLLYWHEESRGLSAEEVDIVEHFLVNRVVSFWECREKLRQDAQLSPLGDAILGECETFMRTSFALTDA